MKTIKTLLSTFLLLQLLGTSMTIGAANASPAANIVALKTEQPFTLDGIPGETFWGQAPATYVNLKATTTSGGNVPTMLVKAAHNGTYVFLLLQWPDGTESRKLDRPKRLVTSTPGNLTGQYFYNSTHYYPDAATVTWWMGEERPTVGPATNDEFGPSPTRRASLFGWSGTDEAELWMFKASILDLGNPKWPHSGIENKWNWGAKAGQEYTMPYSSAVQSRYNTTGNWVLGDGLIHSIICQQPGTEAFEVRSRGVWSSGMWTLELARPFVSSPKNSPYTMDFRESKTYWIVVAAFDGNKGEWEEVGSMSDWLSLEVSRELNPLEKRTQEAVAAANAATAAASSAATTATAAATTATAATTAAQQAQTAAASATNIAYAAIGLAVVALIAAIAMGLRKR